VQQVGNTVHVIELQGKCTILKMHNIKLLALLSTQWFKT